MEVDANWNFPFPTLKHLSLVSIGQRLIHITGFPNSYFYAYKASSQYEQIVKRFPVPPQFQRDIFIMSTGMYLHLCHWVWCGSPLWPNENYEPIFDVNGVLDEPRTWVRYFERETGKKNTSVEDLRQLLDAACDRTLLPQIDLVLRKILITEGGGATHLLGPRKSIAYGKLILSYSFQQTHRFRTRVPGRRSVYVILRWLKKIRSPFYKLTMTTQGIIVKLDPLNNMDSLKEFFNVLYGASDSWINRVVGPLVLERQATDRILFFLNRLNPADQRKFLSAVPSVKILMCCLRWPFTRFFMPMMKIVRGLGVDDYQSLFAAIVERVPNQPEIDVLGCGDLLLEFWNSLPSGVKREVQYSSIYRMTATMEQLRMKNRTLHSLIVND